jgi:hypothetical protein
MPFCVSSFSALIKGKGFILIFAPKPSDNVAALLLCAGFGAFVATAKASRRGRSRPWPAATPAETPAADGQP